MGGGGGLLTCFKDLIVVAVTPRGWECGYVLYEASEESTWSKEAFFFFFKIALSDEVLENKGMVVIYFLTGN